MEQYLNTKQVAEMLGLSILTVRDLVKDKKIPCYKLGHRTVRFIPSEIDDWVKTRRMNK